VYHEQPSRVPGGITWGSVSTGADVRVLPDGCMDLLWDGRGVVIAGPDTRAQLFASDPGLVLTGLRFAPGYGPRVLGLPADELTDQHVPLDAVWHPAEVRRITDLLATSATPARTLEAIALRYCSESDENTVLIERVVALARGGHSSTTIADRIGLSTRQLQRRSTAAFGYGAKTLNRILRMQQALALVRRGVRAADSAARTGYADQSHLSREVKDMAGVSLTELMR
jgi:AraC-like DNA-binding protein